MYEHVHIYSQYTFQNATFTVCVCLNFSQALGVGPVLLLYPYRVAYTTQLPYSVVVCYKDKFP